MATIVPVIEQLSKTAELAESIEARAKYAAGLARRYGGITVVEGDACLSAQIALNHDELLGIVKTDAIRSLEGAGETLRVLESVNADDLAAIEHDRQRHIELVESLTPGPMCLAHSSPYSIDLISGQYRSPRESLLGLAALGGRDVLENISGLGLSARERRGIMEDINLLGLSTRERRDMLDNIGLAGLSAQWERDRLDNIGLAGLSGLAGVSRETEAQLADLTDSLTSAWGPTIDRFSDLNQSIFDSIQPLARAGAIAKAAIAPMLEPFAQAGESIRRDILDYATMFDRIDRLASFDLPVEYGLLADRELPALPRRGAIVAVGQERPLTRDELEDILDHRLDQQEERLLVMLQAQIQKETQQSGIVVAGGQLTPPLPDENGHTWADVFDWFYWVAPRGHCLTLESLARMVFRTYKHVQRMHSEYLDQHPELATRKKRKY